MIRNDNEYKAALKTLDEQRQQLEQYRAKLDAERMAADDIDEVMEAMLSSHEDLEDEAKRYEGYQAGDLGSLATLRSLDDLGIALIALRIAAGLTQRELASRLKVNESSVSRDERNEYHGVTFQRASRILHALQAEMEIRLALPTRSDESRELRIVDEIDNRTEIGKTNVPARSRTAA